jgi:hypothetical protein
MSKPLGMTSTFQIVHPDRVQDMIWDAIQEARARGVTLDSFKAEVLDSWTEAARQDYEDAKKETWR